MMSHAQKIVTFLVLPILLGGCTTPLHRAAFEGDTKTVLSLLDQGQSIDTRGRHAPLLVPGVTVTAWEAAIIGGHEETVRALLDRRFPVNQQGEDGRTPLQFACIINPNQGLIKLLLEGGANPNLKGESGSTPLISCIDGWDRDRGVRAQAAQVLLEHGADPNIKNDQGRTALSVAAYQGNARAVQHLLGHGAIANTVDYSGETPAQIAENRGFSPIAWSIRKAEERQEVGLVRTPPASSPGISVPSVSAPTPTSDVDRVPSFQSAPRKNAYAVVVGIEQYREKLPRADFADRDARLVREYLTKVLGYAEENVVVRLNERATRTDLEKYLENWLSNNVEKDGSVFVYYSGHGAPNSRTGDAYLVPYDGDPSFIETTGYPLKRLYAALDKLPAKDITVVLDSCFSGMGGRSVLAKGARPMVLSIENPVLVSGKMIVLAASGGDQISNSFEEQGHGLLTYYFLKGLQGEGDANKDGVIQMTELYDYVKPNVQRISRKYYNNEQTPQLLASPDVLKRGGGRLLDRTRP